MMGDVLRPEAIASHLVCVALVVFTAIRTSKHDIRMLPTSSDAEYNNGSCTSSCGNIRIRFPFRLDSDPGGCAACSGHDFELSCENNRTIFGVEEKHFVQAINYDDYTIRLAAPVVDKDNCSLHPRVSIFLTSSIYSNCFFKTEIRLGHSRDTRKISESLTFMSCEKLVTNNPSYISTYPCIHGSKMFSGKNKGKNYNYVVYGDFNFSDLEESCQAYLVTLVSSRNKTISSYRDINYELVHEFELSWLESSRKTCKSNLSCNYSCGSVCWTREILRSILREVINGLATLYYHTVGMILCVDDDLLEAEIELVLLLGPRTIVGISFVIALVIYKWKRRHLSSYIGIEEFLQSHNNLVSIRYAYSEIKKMTEGFKTKLGEGGFGSVYKGKLRSGNFVAIKMLGESKSSGQDFINEVATIGRIHHVNIVRLVGFCVEGSKRALVYDFMPNGSLDKFIFSREGISSSLNTKEIFEISLGVARGIEYLHRGCDMQILHFDIKPHNILLDENFTPKVSDFGLARLCPLDNSLVSMTAARGTIGYIAPELFYKNIGGVSYKADVYSFGMLLMEMANRRRNVNVQAENSSQIYFPTWIYDQFSNGKGIEVEDNVTEEESKTTKKMTMVALWCIQLKPCDRPSMSKVIEMLEGEVEQLQLPPKPSFCPQESDNAGDFAIEASTTTWSSTSIDENSQDLGLDQSAD